MDDLAKNLPQIIKESAASPLGILALMIIALAILAFFFFKRASEKARVIVFVMLFRSETVAVNSAKEGLVVFSIPLAARSAQLQVGQPAYGFRLIPIDLRAPR